MRFEPELEPELAHLDTASNENGFGVATSSSPFQSISQGDEHIAAPETIPNGRAVPMRPFLIPFRRTRGSSFRATPDFLASNSHAFHSLP
jgi:hypothetical protein